MRIERFRAKLILVRKRFGCGINRQGFNLLELILASLLFGTIATAFLGVFTQHAKAIDKARMQLMASHLAQTRMSELVAVKFDGIDALLPPEAAPSWPPAEPPTVTTMDITIRGTARQIDFLTYSQNFQTVDGEREVAVWTTWEENNAIRFVTFRTVLAPNG